MKTMMMFAMLFASACGCKKATTPVAPVATVAPAQPPMPGGHFDQPVDSDEAKTRANQAIELLRVSQKDPSIALTKLKAFSQQVVAGMNYDFELDVTTAAGPKSIKLEMFQALNDGPRTISWVTGF